MRPAPTHCTSRRLRGRVKAARENRNSIIICPFLLLHLQSHPTLLPPSPDLNEATSKGSLLPTGQGSREGPGQESICHHVLCVSLNPSRLLQGNNSHQSPWHQLQPDQSLCPDWDPKPAGGSQTCHGCHCPRWQSPSQRSRKGQPVRTGFSLFFMP